MIDGRQCNLDQMSRDFVENKFVVTIRRLPDTLALANETWCNPAGERDRDGGLPAFVIYGDNGRLDQEWWENGVLHREDGPAILYDRMSQSEHPTHEEWYRHGQLHREGNLPAKIERKRNGQLIEEVYAVDGKLHRTDGPALIRRSWKTGRVLQKEYWLHGVRQPAPAPGGPSPSPA